MQHRLNVLAALLALTAWWGPVAVSAETITIDARKGITPELVQDYQKAVAGDTRDRFHHVRVKLLVDGRNGFDAGWLVVPDRRISQRVEIEVFVRRGNVISAPIRVNAMDLNGRRLKQLESEVRLK